MNPPIVSAPVAASALVTRPMLVSLGVGVAVGVLIGLAVCGLFAPSPVATHVGAKSPDRSEKDGRCCDIVIAAKALW